MKYLETSGSKSQIFKKKLWQHPGAERTFNALVKAGCDPKLLQFLLGPRPTDGRRWTNTLRMIAAEPKKLKSLAHELDCTARALELTVGKSFIPILLGLRVDCLVDEIRILAHALKHFSQSSELRELRKKFSYRQMGKTLSLALLCHYVRSTTGGCHYRKLAELWSAANEKTLAEDTLRHRARRITSSRGLDGNLPKILNDFLSMTNRVAQL
jgi:hypothetical protein